MLRWQYFTLFMQLNPEGGNGPLLRSRYYYLEYFGAFWNSKYQYNEFETPEKTLHNTIHSNWKGFPPATDPWKVTVFLSVCTILGLDMGSWITIANQSRFPRSGFCDNYFRIKVLIYALCARNLRKLPWEIGNIISLCSSSTDIWSICFCFFTRVILVLTNNKSYTFGYYIRWGFFSNQSYN